MLFQKLMQNMVKLLVLILRLMMLILQLKQIIKPHKVLRLGLKQAWIQQKQH